jgi:hypothetical protein
VHFHIRDSFSIKLINAADLPEVGSLNILLIVTWVGEIFFLSVLAIPTIIDSGIILIQESPNTKASNMNKIFIYGTVKQIDNWIFFGRFSRNLQASKY